MRPPILIALAAALPAQPVAPRADAWAVSVGYPRLSAVGPVLGGRR